MFTDCALIFSTKGDMSVAQRHTFLGIIFDTHRGRLFITAEKFDKLMVLLREIMDLLTCSPRSMTKLRGKAQYQFRCLEGVRPFLPRFDRFIGGQESAYEWDLEKEVPGAEMWPLEPSTAYFRWSKGLPTQYGDLVVATWDASVHGIALSIAIKPGQVYQLEGMRFDGVSTIVTFEDTPEVQAHREAAGAPMAMRLLRRLFNLRDRTVLLRNDCLPVILPYEKVHLLQFCKGRRKTCARRRWKPVAVCSHCMYPAYSL
jgi:hypothetical protein